MHIVKLKDKDNYGSEGLARAKRMFCNVDYAYYVSRYNIVIFLNTNFYFRIFDYSKFKCFYTKAKITDDILNNLRYKNSSSETSAEYILESPNIPDEIKKIITFNLNDF